MTERKYACNKLFSILVGPQHREVGFPISADNASWRCPNIEADFLSAYNNVQVGVGPSTKRISKGNSTDNASWGRTK
ncbi:conserved hypothetical protein [Staphylococcus aureus RF122]|nr:conserved hypothetical protein [Staphylococcus aureus RF122]